MLNKKITLFIFSFVLLLSTTKIYSQGYKFESIKTYEGGRDDINREARVYENSYNQISTRYIRCEVALKNNLYGTQSQTHKAKWNYYKPDGSLFGTVSDDWTIESSWETTWFSRGWGWDEPGNWENGKYLIEFYLDDNYIASISFFIVGTNRISPTISYKSLRFFENPIVAVEQDKRIYSTTFSKSKARYIRYEVYVDNLLYNISDNQITLNATYYNGNNEIVGQPVLNFNIPMSWSAGYLHHGWGWDEPGNWKPGNYKVEIRYLNDLFAVSYFTITND
ncbi:MAG: hypothetical protein NTZ27_02220 [Ignavibacteriales bacterium]|nr:hypothetical protein [Ignavibacteriales bacterium]